MRIILIVPVRLFACNDDIDSDRLFLACHLIITVDKGSSRQLLIGNHRFRLIHTKDVVDERKASLLRLVLADELWLTAGEKQSGA